MVKKCILCENERFLIKSSFEELRGLTEEHQSYSFFCYNCLFNKPFPTIKECKYSFCQICETSDVCNADCKLQKALISEGPPESKIIYYMT
jgi:hypothetical protein